MVRGNHFGRDASGDITARHLRRRNLPRIPVANPPATAILRTARGSLCAALRAKKAATNSLLRSCGWSFSCASRGWTREVTPFFCCRQGGATYCLTRMGQRQGVEASR